MEKFSPIFWYRSLFGDKFQINTFNAVFLPTFLSIIGVIFYLRLGYVVGEAGIIGAIAIILLAVSVTFSTALALSSITTNIKIGDGGAYSIVSKTLGLEVGGSVGIPLFLAQVFSVSLYLFGFAEGWAFIFPEHPQLLVLTLAFLTLISLLTIKLHVALKIQQVVFGLVVLSILVVWLPFDWVSQSVSIPYVGDFTHMGFWALFALFFPAVTGLMAGIGLSGELSNPRKQIPQGVLIATGITTVLYIVMVFWFGSVATTQELITNNLVMVDFSSISIIVLIGLLGATYSSALTTFLAAPRLLAGMGAKGILPFSDTLKQKNAHGLPIPAIIITACIIGSSFFLGGIDVVAPVLTMFFLITYSAINIVVFTEQSLGLPSFRPKLKIPKIVPLYGAIGSVICMFLINPLAAAVSLVLLLIIYFSLVKKNLVSDEGDIRSGLFMVLAERAAKKISRLPESQKHVWKPTVLFPTMTGNNLRAHYPLLHGIIAPNGTLTVLGMQHAQGDKLPEDGKLTTKDKQKETKDIHRLVKRFGKEEIFTSFSDISITDYTSGICVALETIEGQIFHPNILFLPFEPNTLYKRDITTIYETAKRHQVGVILFSPNQNIRLGSEKDIHIRIPEEAMHTDMHDAKVYDLAMLLGYALHKNRQANITLCMATKSQRKAKEYLTRLVNEARYPDNATIEIFDTDLHEAIKNAPEADLDILSISHEQIDTMKDLGKLNKSILFVTDAGGEDILS